MLQGRDLIAAGVAPGRAIGELLDRALAATMAGAVSNNTADLLSFLDL